MTWKKVIRQANRALAVKQSIDRLPVGICCYWPDGLVKLKNTEMERLSFSIFDRSLLDGARFWRELQEGAGDAVYIQTGEVPVLRLRDGRVRRFTREPLALDRREIYEILAVDLTDEYNRNEELQQKQEHVQAMNERMRRLNSTIEEMVREKEILSAKVRVHDDLSRALLTGRQYLTQDKPENRAELLGLWNKTATMLFGDSPDEWRDKYQYAFETAQEFGIEIRLDGMLPQEEGQKNLISAALITCLSNAFRHGGADVLYMRVTETEQTCTAEFRNNGAPPSGPISEQGGLGNLRRLIERGGGAMEVFDRPEFLLRITLKKGEPADELSRFDC